MSAKFRFLATYNIGANGNPEEDRNNRSFGYVSAYHKRPWDDAPFRVPNEYVCSRLAEFIGLPTPPCVLTFSDIVRAPVIFSSLNFNAGGDNLPPVFPDKCVSNLPNECTGILLFDIWVANEDRHDNNLAVDNVVSPTKIIVFDHDMALLGGSRTVGVDRLYDLQSDRLGVTGGTVTGGNKHCLLTELNTTEHFGEWLYRIANVPSYFVKKLCDDLRKFKVLTDDQAKAIVDFLIFRQSQLSKIIEKNRAEFSGIQNWTPPGELPL